MSRNRNFLSSNVRLFDNPDRGEVHCLGKGFNRVYIDLISGSFQTATQTIMSTRCTKKTKTKSAVLPTSLMSFFHTYSIYCFVHIYIFTRRAARWAGLGSSWSGRWTRGWPGTSSSPREPLSSPPDKRIKLLLSDKTVNSLLEICKCYWSLFEIIEAVPVKLCS